MLHVTAVGWAATIALIAGLLVLDLLVSARRRRAISFNAALGWSVFYVMVALLFGVVFGSLAGWDVGVQYFAGYLVEKSLSVDNLFVFVIILATFAVPAELQSRALTTGIVLALLLRGALIALGAALIAAFSFMFLIFGLALVVTAVQLYRHRAQDPTVQNNPLLALARRSLPFTDSYQSHRMLTHEGGRRVLTPLVLVLLAIGSTDMLFALDSIPAVFGVTQHPYIVFVANAFALLGLRALFFLVQGLLDRLVYLSLGLAVILGFIGMKLILHFVHTQSDSVPEISTGVSMGVIAAVLAVTTIASLIKARRDPTARAHAGALRAPPQAENHTGEAQGAVRRRTALSAEAGDVSLGARYTSTPMD
jgi:tellurite resistance protein TerC